MNSLKDPIVLAALAVVFVLGAAYGPKTPVVATVAAKLPGSALK